MRKNGKDRGLENQPFGWVAESLTKAWPAGLVAAFYKFYSVRCKRGLLRHAEFPQSKQIISGIRTSRVVSKSFDNESGASSWAPSWHKCPCPELLCFPAEKNHWKIIPFWDFTFHPSIHPSAQGAPLFLSRAPLGAPLLVRWIPQWSVLEKDF